MEVSYEAASVVFSTKTTAESQLLRIMLRTEQIPFRGGAGVSGEATVIDRRDEQRVITALRQWKAALWGINKAVDDGVWPS